MTDLTCKCGTSRLEDVQCAECGAYFKVGWIPVSERLPERYHEFYLISQNGDEPLIAYLDITNNWLHNTGEYLYPTHWTPLPQPPEAE